MGSLFACSDKASRSRFSLGSQEKRTPEDETVQNADSPTKENAKRSPQPKTEDKARLEVPETARGSLHMDSKWFDELEEVMPEEISKLFVCVQIPQEVQDRIYERLEDFITKHDLKDVPDVIWQRGIMLHMTLLYIGNANKFSIINDLGDEMESEYFTNRLSSFSHRKTAKLRVMSNMPNGKLTALAQEVMDLLPDYKGDITRFKGHISLCVFDRKCERAQEIVDAFMEECGEISLNDIEWEIQEISLFSSDQRPYTCQHTISLRKPPTPVKEGRFKRLSQMGKTVSEKFRNLGGFLGDFNDDQKEESVTTVEPLKGDKRKKPAQEAALPPVDADSIERVVADDAGLPESPVIKDVASLDLSNIRSNGDLAEDCTTALKEMESDKPSASSQIME